MSLCEAKPDVTPELHRELDALAKDISRGTTGRYTEADTAYLTEAALRLATHAWRKDVACHLCPRWMHRHGCSCPIYQARRRLHELGVWPEWGW